MSDQSPPDGVAGEDGTLEKTDGGKMLDCVGDDIVQKFTVGEESGGQLAEKAAVQGFVGL